MSLMQAERAEDLDGLAGESGLAVVVVDKDGRELSASNNSSICSVLYSSPEFSPLCAADCGRAFERVAEAGGPADYECHAGLSCRVVPHNGEGQNLVAIVGRAFVKAENYRKATDKAINGEWKRFRPTEFFANVLLTSSAEKIHAAAAKAEIPWREGPTEAVGELAAAADIRAEAPAQTNTPDRKINELLEKFGREAFPEPAPSQAPRAASPEEAAAWRSLFGSLMTMEYREALDAVLKFVSERISAGSLMWFERRNDRLELAAARGALKRKPVKLGISPASERFRDALRTEKPLTFRERMSGEQTEPRKLSLFPVFVGGDLRRALAVEGLEEDQNTYRSIFSLCRAIGPQLEILRLRSEVDERDSLARAVRRFNESLKRIDSDDFWTRVTQVSAELLSAERASLLVRNESSGGLRAKAAIGARTNLFSEARVGERVAKAVLEGGEPVVVTDIDNVAMKAAPAEWSYKTGSFLSYPITMDARGIAVLNFTDKAGGEVFNERDIEILQAIAPQIAVAIDRTTLREKAGEFEQLSVTDALTGLLNRRYLEKRLDEEIERSKRHRFPMSLMLLDVDEFKPYNDAFGHQAGDEALRIVAAVLKETVRGEDVASRYGGEEFAILLPQTTSAEAKAIAERIRRRVERAQFPKRRVTVSIGIAACSTAINSGDDLVGAADQALYEAKTHGRNNVQIYDSLSGAVNNKIN